MGGKGSGVSQVASLVGQLDDEDIRLAVKQLALDVLSDVQQIRRLGDPSIKLQIARALIPSLVKSLQRQDENAEITEMKDQLATMMREMREERGDRVKIVQPDIPQDIPRPKVV